MKKLCFLALLFAACSSPTQPKPSFLGTWYLAGRVNDTVWGNDTTHDTTHGVSYYTFANQVLTLYDSSIGSNEGPNGSVSFNATLTIAPNDYGYGSESSANDSLFIGFLDVSGNDNGVLRLRISNDSLYGQESVANGTIPGAYVKFTRDST